MPGGDPRPERMWWLLPMVLLVNLSLLGLLMAYRAQ